MLTPQSNFSHLSSHALFHRPTQRYEVDPLKKSVSNSVIHLVSRWFNTPFSTVRTLTIQRISNYLSRTSHPILFQHPPSNFLRNVTSFHTRSSSGIFLTQLGFLLLFLSARNLDKNPPTTNLFLMDIFLTPLTWPVVENWTFLDRTTLPPSPPSPPWVLFPHKSPCFIGRRLIGLFILITNIKSLKPARHFYLNIEGNNHVAVRSDVSFPPAEYQRRWC